MKNYINVIIICLTVIISIFIFTRPLKDFLQRADNIVVTGLAKKDFTSDLIVWNGSFSRKSGTIQEAYGLLKKDLEIIKKYFADKGLGEQEVVFSSVNINKMFKPVEKQGGYGYMDVFDGYTLTQDIQIESKEIEKIEKISREITELIDLGVELYSPKPQYYYTKLSELKLEMLASATQDARVRAEKIAENAGSKIGNLQSADMGIFQITAQNSSENYSWGGTFNTDAKRKTASITVKLTFKIE